jgi:hypothetical protein
MGVGLQLSRRSDCVGGWQFWRRLERAAVALGVDRSESGDILTFTTPISASDLEPHDPGYKPTTLDHVIAYGCAIAIGVAVGRVAGGLATDDAALTVGEEAAGRTLPRLEISASENPDLAENIMHAQKAGHPDVLTWGGDSEANRAAALEDVPSIKGSTRDEYPFCRNTGGR